MLPDVTHYRLMDQMAAAKSKSSAETGCPFFGNRPVKTRGIPPSISIAAIDWPLNIAGRELPPIGAGGLAGYQFGKGSGKTAATGAGVVGGAVVGHELTSN